MNRIIILFLTIAIVYTLLSCGPSLSVLSDFDPGYNYKEIKAYKWKMIRYPKQGAARVNRFKKALKEELSRKGITESIERADFEILIRGFSKTQTSTMTMGYSYGGYWGGTNVYASLSEEGTIVIEFIDIEKKEIFWQGVVKGTLEEDLSIEAQKEKFTDIAKTLFAVFPPEE